MHIDLSIELFNLLTIPFDDQNFIHNGHISIFISKRL